MKKTSVALTFLISTLAVTLLVPVVFANPFMPSGSWSDEPIPPVINVQSPTEKLDYWIGSDVWLDFTVTVPLTAWYSKNINTFSGHIGTTFGKVTEVRFSLDGMQEQEAAKVSEHQGVLTYSVNLGRLPFGKHAVTIGAEGSAHYGTLTKDNSIQDTNTKLVQSSMTINFVVDEVRPTSPPSISLLSPTNTTYYWILNWTHIPYVRLEYSAEDTRLSVGYSFDGDNNITPANNGTTLYIPIQSRRLTLYATDAFENKATPQTVYYEILRDPRAQPTETWPLIHSYRPEITLPSNNPASIQGFTVVPVVAGVAVVALVASASLLVYLKKRRPKSGGKT